ncbi:hypothetical protein ACFVDQ_06690 [Streptomyces sp. NPDC057684]|uniref:hypothetical protein n=1 Tax=unclassified Streptomyces TaxID=2593676 RepID=UPI0036A36774
MQQESLTPLEATLREEAGADDGDPLPALMAGQINWIRTTPLSRIGAGMIKARPAGEVSREALGPLDEMEVSWAGRCSTKPHAKPDGPSGVMSVIRDVTRITSRPHDPSRTLMSAGEIREQRLAVSCKWYAVSG